MKRILSMFLVIVLIISMVPGSLITAHAIDSRVEKAIQWAISIANDDTHGYSQENRNGPDYDCSSFVSTAFKNAGFGVSGSLNTGNMLNAFTSAGFTKYNKGAVSLQRGDILLRPKTSSRYGHTELYIGNNQCVAAHDNYDDKTGDGNGKEINVRSKNYCTFCKNSDYTYILRYEGSSSYDNYTYSFSFNANGGTLGSSGAFSVSYGEQFEILNTTCTRSGYTWAGWNVKRNNDNKWYVSGQGWCTESQISSNGYVKKTYSNYETATLNDSWTSGISGDCSYTFYAKWIQSRQTRIRIFMSPYGRGYDHITAINNSTNSGFAQEFIYAWYILYDANTGELLNTYSNDNYSVELAIYDPNGSLVFNENYTGSNDANWIGISPQMSGTYTATAKVSGDLIGSVTTTYEVFYDADLISSKNAVSLNLNGTNTSTIVFTPTGGYPGKMGYTGTYDSSIASITDDCWSNGEIYVTLQGKKVGSFNLTLKLYENYTGNKNVVATITIPVTVTGDSYTITYNANGGAGAPSSQTKYYDTDIALSSTVPTGKSYTVNFNGNGGTVATSSKTYSQTFSNWNTYQSGEGASYAPGSIFSSNIDVTMYAQWNNPSLGDITQPTRSGYYFMGWYDSTALGDNGLPVGKRYLPNSSITGNITLYAMWSKSPTVMYGDSDLNGVIEPIDITNFNRYRINGTTDDEILFRGDVDADGDLDFTDVTYINNVRIGAISYSSLPAYQNFDGFYINGYPKRTYEYGETFDSSGLSCYVCYTTGTCYIFNNNLSVSGYDPYKIGTQTLTVNYYQYSTTFNITVKSPQYTIYYDANGGSVSSTGKTVTYGNSIGTLPTPTREGYTFLGWSFSNSGTNYVTSSTAYSYMSNKTLYALWKLNPTILNANSTNDAVISSAGEMIYYTFTPTTSGLYVIYSTGTSDSKVYLYNANGTELDNDDDSGDNTNFRLEYNLTAGTQYTFGIKYYNTSLTGTIPFTFRRVYTLTYDANGGTGAPSSQKKEHGAGIFISSTEPIKNGYTFMGWSTSNSATLATYQPGSGFSNNADTTLYAVWKPTPTVLNVNSTNSATISASGEMKYFTYTPDTTGTYVIYSTGSVDSKVYLYDANGTELDNDDDSAGDRNFRLEYNLTANTEYTFGVCCYSSLTGTIPFTFGRVYTITYNANGGTGVPNSQKKDYGKTLSLSSTEPTRNGYEFLGWATSSTATSASYQPEDDFTNNVDITLFAVWEENVVLSSISVYSNPDKLGYYLGDSFDSTGLKIKLTYSDGSTEIITSGFTLSYLNFKTTPGTKTITVSYKGQKTTFNVTVVTPYITLSSSSKSLIIGDISTITATTTPFAQSVVWTSSDTSVATVANGVITAKAEGAAIITAEFIYNGITYSETCDVTVSKPVHNHTASNWIVDRDATCTVDGSKHKECTTCGETIETSTIIASGHNYIWEYDYENLIKTGTCSVCGDVSVEVIPITEVFTFTLNGDGSGYILSDCISDYTGKVIVPEEYDDLPVTSIGTDAFRDCKGITSVVIPDSVISIGGSAFRECTNLTEIILPDNITSIPGAMCYGCTKLETVVISAGVVNIGGYAFSSCTSLVNVNLPESIKVIGNYTFNNCSNLNDVYFDGYKTKWETISIGTNNDSLLNATIHYKTVEHNYGDWVVTLKPTCTQEGTRSKTCSICGDVVTETILAHGHNYIEQGTENNHPHSTAYKCLFCKNIKTEENTVSDCVECNFTINAIDSSNYKLVSYIGDETDVVIPALHNGRFVTTIANSCFKGNTSIKSVKIADGVTSIGSLAFMNCTSLEKVVIPASVTSIGAQAFYGFTGTIYCIGGSYAHEYAVSNNIDYVIVSFMETTNTQIDYDNFVIYTSEENCNDITKVINVSETALAVPTASHISGNLELYGTGTTITVFDGNDYIGDFTLVVIGDTNGDSVCDILDCFEIERAANGNTNLSGAYAMAADTNSDDVIDITDYQSIVNKAIL